MFRRKNTNTIRVVIEDIAEELYYKRLAVTSIKYLFLLGVPKLRFTAPLIFITLSQPTFLKNINEINLFFVRILFDRFKRINKHVEENNQIFIEFIKEVIKLYTVNKCIGRNYNDTSCDGIPIFDYSKNKGFRIYQKTLF